MLDVNKKILHIVNSLLRDYERAALADLSLSVTRNINLHRLYKYDDTDIAFLIAKIEEELHIPLIELKEKDWKSLTINDFLLSPAQISELLEPYLEFLEDIPQNCCFREGLPLEYEEDGKTIVLIEPVQYRYEVRAFKRLLYSFGFVDINYKNKNFKSLLNKEELELDELFSIFTYLMRSDIQNDGEFGSYLRDGTVLKYTHILYALLRFRKGI